jgi:thermitase
VIPLKRFLSFAAALILCILLAGVGYGADLPYVEGEALVKFKPGLKGEMAERRRVLSDLQVQIRKYYSSIDVYRVKGQPGDRTEDIIRRLKQDPDVESVEPNYKRYLKAVTPNDPLFASQWALETMMCPEAWESETGDRSIVVAFADSGIDYEHEDLRNNLWKNLGEDWVGGNPGNNGIDDDGDGYIDDYYGINTITGSGDPFDDEGHGTHVSGIAGAQGNNAKGVAGVNWQISIMALKFIGAGGFGDVGDEIDAIDFAKKHGVRVINMSFGSTYYSDQERNAIANAPGILFIAAAGNERANNDVVPSYPANYDLPNIISVAGSDQSDNSNFSSNYGPNSVHVAAPGADILSTFPGDDYQSLSGTSMSTAFVSGLAGLVLAKKPAFTITQLKDQILRTADVTPGLQEKTLTGGRINAYRALAETVTGPYIYKISPNKGPEGTQVTLRGSQFGTTVGHVIFNDSQEASIVSWSNERIVATVPVDAQSGTVAVVTVNRTSNQVAFEVTLYPIGIRLSFPHVYRDDGLSPVLVLSNPLDQPAEVVVKFINEGCKNATTLEIITLRPFEKYFLTLRKNGETCPEIMVTCESTGFFGAALVSVSENDNRVLVIPHLQGGPTVLEGPKQ